MWPQSRQQPCSSIYEKSKKTQNTQIENKDREAEVTGQQGEEGKKVQRKQRERRARGQEGEAIKVRRKGQRLGRGMLKKWGKKEVGRLKRQKPSDTRYSLSLWIQQALMSNISCLYVVSN